MGTSNTSALSRRRLAALVLVAISVAWFSFLIGKRMGRLASSRGPSANVCQERFDILL